MNRLDDTIANVAYILDSLMTLQNIYDSGSCNDCGISAICNFKPKLGQMVRYNCPFYEREGEENG